MVRSSLRAAATVTVAALLLGGASTFAGPAVAEQAPAVAASDRYIVVLGDAPLASYDGGTGSYSPTRPVEGASLDVRSRQAEAYGAFLAERRRAVAASAGAEPTAEYAVVLNGFSAALSPQQVARLSGDAGVEGVYPDRILHVASAPSADAAARSGTALARQAVTAPDAAGAGVVVGIVDSGIDPEHPSFAGEPLGAEAGAEPYLEGDTVVFEKGDGGTFRSSRVGGEEWSSAAYSTTLVGARYFADGATAAGFGFGAEHLSPRDSSGHGSHTASIAAGRAGVEATLGEVGLGPIAGIAPAARIAVYKACWDGPDPRATVDDVCATSDLLSAVDAAVGDGVDVIEFAVAGDAPPAAGSPLDLAFRHAATAGVFVAVGAGGAGPGASTAAFSAPWYTTVGAATAHPLEGTVTLAGAWHLAGASASVIGRPVPTVPIVYAGDAAAAGETAVNAALCFPGTLDEAAVAGAIVVCDRGTNDRVEKSVAVRDAGGVGMVLVNATPNATETDIYAVPTVHLSDEHRDALLAYVRGNPDATASLSEGNLAGTSPPGPQLAEWSGRGPAGAGGLIGPDVAAPGVDVVGAAGDEASGDPAFAFRSGTSMASAYVAGLAALYLDATPDATPGEVKSALMTTAFDLVGADGLALGDPFAQGAGHVDATRFLDPGVVYRNGPDDWAPFVEGRRQGDPGEANLAAVVVGDLPATKTVTRTLTATREGIYTATASIPGVEVIVSPAGLQFTAPGETRTFTIAFTGAGAPPGVWATGLLEWTGLDGTVVRSPLAVKPAGATTPDSVRGEGIDGSTPITITPGVSGELPVSLAGLAPETLLVDPAHTVAGHSGDQDSGDADGQTSWVVEVAPGTSLARWTLDATDRERLGLRVYQVTGPQDPRFTQRWLPDTDAGRERVTIDRPAPGWYRVVVSTRSSAGPLTWDLTQAIVAAGGEGALAVSPVPLGVDSGVEQTLSVSWSGLKPGTAYLGVVRFADSAARTLVEVAAGAAPPAAAVAPKLKGTPKLGERLTADPGRWHPGDVKTTFQWLRDGEPIPGATRPFRTVTAADVGTALSVRVTATRAGNMNPGSAETAALFVKHSSTTIVTMDRYSGTASDSYAVTVRVVSTPAPEAADATPGAFGHVGPASTGPVPDGTVDVRVGERQYTGTLAGGVVTFHLPRQAAGTHDVTAQYRGSATVEASVGFSAFVVK
ncbi:S8 family serine peptidase [Microbacterium sp. BWT-B31]|uniref:S8 family serine peptidase n=1 Tax=Microbacterium sp. BWT-B31 TaxID=3232072 RepID=UPI003529B0FF